MQIYLKELAGEIKADLDNGAVGIAGERIEMAKLQQHHMIAFWTLFDSKQRAILTGYLNIVKADTLEKLKAAWEPITKEAKLVLEPIKEAAKLKLDSLNRTGA
jgi:hypothetical protein